MLVIERAVASLGEDRFRQEYWDRSSAYFPALADSAEVSSVLDQISVFLDRTDIRYPSLRLAKDGAEIPLGDYTRELRLGPHQSHDWIVNELVYSQYNQGATIILQMLQNSLPSYGPIANRLESYFGANIQASCFITPPNSQGFTAHYDTYPFFAIQLFGSKDWALYDSRPLLPIRDDREDDEHWSPVPPSQELSLRAGDVLFVPRGLYHSARASALPSIHLTLGIFAPSWLDVLKASLRDIQDQPWLRESVAPGLPGGAALDAPIAEAKSRMLHDIDLRAGIDALRHEVFARHIDTRHGRLRDVLRQDLTSSQTYQRQSVPFTLLRNGDSIALRFGNKEIKLPSFVEPLLEVIANGKPFVASSLPSVLDEDSTQRLLRKLLVEGFISAI